jgi:predicted transposase/invertase (TIGR01784 family)
MERILPYSDFFIRYLLGSESNQDLLLSFLNAVQSDSDLPDIASVQVINPFNLKSSVTDKESVLDIKAKDSVGRFFNIEVQIAGNKEFRHRSLYYLTRIYANQLKAGVNYKNLKPCIGISILNFIMLQDLPKAHNIFLLMEKDSPHPVLTNHLMFHFLELPKIAGQMNEKSIKLNSRLSNWLYFLQNEGIPEDKKMKYLLDDDKDLARAHEEYVKFTQDDHLREQYEARMKWQRDHESLLESAREEGNYQAKCQSAVTMIKAGKLKFQEIAEYTDLTLEDIERLAKK